MVVDVAIAPSPVAATQGRCEAPRSGATGPFDTRFARDAIFIAGSQPGLSQPWLVLGSRVRQSSMFVVAAIARAATGPLAALVGKK